MTVSSPTFPERPAELRAVFKGVLTGAAARDWRDGLIDLAARRPHRLVLDLREVTFLDASVIATVRALERRLAPVRGAVALLAHDRLAARLRVLGVDHLLADPEPNGSES
jgi:anti-anti-sigma regulatory factor